MKKKDYDQIVLSDGNCGEDKELGGLICLCDTDLCNDGKQDDKSGVETIVPQVVNIFLLSLFVHYFTI